MANYLYNGIELPDINEVWTDKETYKYAYISEKNGAYYLTVSKIKKTVDNVEGPILVDTLNTALLETTVSYKLSNDEWVQYSGGYRFRSIPVWASVDIQYEGCEGVEDGTLYLAASDPVPVLPEPLPVSPYLCKNGAWVKHDIYKQVGNSWVKQPQGAVEVEGGAWSALS